ncbi:hypothetical protein ASE19_11275 [Nocardioides sp. Root79]|nr:hypothetical protein ASE19_11275 [Nocardioides sp. Root79]
MTFLARSISWSPRSGLHSTMKLILPSDSAVIPSFTASTVMILMSLPGSRPAASIASMAPRPMSSLWAKTTSMPFSELRNDSMTCLPPSRVKSPVCDLLIAIFESDLIASAKPSARSIAGAAPVVPSSWTTLMSPSPSTSASAAFSTSHSPAFLPSSTKSEPRKVL